MALNTTTATCASQPSARTAFPSLSITALLAVAGLMRQRRALRELEPHLLSDIGISRADALAEADRPIWDLPRNR